MPQAALMSPKVAPLSEEDPDAVRPFKGSLSLDSYSHHNDTEKARLNPAPVPRVAEASNLQSNGIVAPMRNVGVFPSAAAWYIINPEVRCVYHV